MANKKTRAIDKQEFELIISTIQKGFITNTGQRIRPNVRVAATLCCEANLGLRIGDIVKLKLSDIVYESGRYHLDIIEEKTRKKRTFTVPHEIYTYLQGYALENSIKPRQRLFDMTVRAVQSHLKLATDYLGLENVSTHSFRKFFANSIYQQDYNVEIVRTLLNHSSIAVTQHYLSVDTKQVEQALQKHIVLPA
ncbi:tyrosine-type recombinase/integrase [Sedimentibacter hydroxybenzoicus DSM 7310]|uniref:Tyrosine-type recombinase/integrase n=1 Tax=Sedimentibacter hydroxybenzoicus DSM 7310 TaxID=1123245 RepID=A0A974GVV7_SEDHY|nr:tyrosine-type recombinase/integrase [Sedimentibacter hydroxybenzoicus]NYB73778.1 tyrosine-type recombinase/integrase [Sedimentibacter hydroxybenzoicus DSM 7310]